MGSIDRLIQHYNDKYKYNPQENIADVKLVDRPIDRFQAAVWLAGRGESMLDVGCGDGRAINSLRNKFKSIVGLEMSSERVKLLKKAFDSQKNIEIILGNIEDFSIFSNRKFDTILMNAVIEHLIDPFGVVTYLRDLLNPGGRLIIITPNVAKWTRRIKLMFGLFPSTASSDEGFTRYNGVSSTDLLDDAHFHYFTYGGLKKLLLRRCKFSCVHEYGFGKLGIIHQFFRNLLSNDCCVVAIK